MYLCTVQVSSILLYLQSPWFLPSTDSQRQWPNSQLGPLNPRDRHFPLPGLVGTASPQSHQLATPPVHRDNLDFLTADLPEERRISILHQYLHTAEEVSAVLLQLDRLVYVGGGYSRPTFYIVCLGHFHN